MGTIVANHAGCTECGRKWFLGGGRIAYTPFGWVGPCCRPLNEDGTIRDIEAELG